MKVKSKKVKKFKKEVKILDDSSLKMSSIEAKDTNEKEIHLSRYSEAQWLLLQN